MSGEATLLRLMLTLDLPAGLIVKQVRGRDDRVRAVIIHQLVRVDTDVGFRPKNDSSMSAMKARSVRWMI